MKLDNSFVDNYIAGANGDFVKVYLYLVRHDMIAQVEEIADALNLTERDVKRAIAYWEERDLLVADADVPGACTSEEMDALSENDEFRALLYGLQKYLNTVFSTNDAEIIAFIYEKLKMPADLIEYIFQLCKQKGKTNLHYIEKVAQDWHRRGITSVEAAQDDEVIFAREISMVEKSFGIKGRDLAPSELAYITRWFKEEKHSIDEVEEACSKTILNTGKASFAYADSILNNSGSQNKNGNSVSENTQSKKTAARAGHTAPRKTNFEQRNTELDSDIMEKFNDLIK